LGGGAYTVTRPSSRPFLKSTVATEIAARRTMLPFCQGELSALCGAYAIINALRLALAEVDKLSDAECRSLFARGVEYLDRRGWLVEALIDGLDPCRRNALARHLAKLVSTTNFEVGFEKPDHRGWSIAHVFDWIQESLAVGAPILVSLTGGLEHHTVVAGVTHNRLKLFDSSGHHFLRRTSCGVRTGHYRLPLSALLRVTVKRRT